MLELLAAVLQFAGLLVGLPGDATAEYRTSKPLVEVSSAGAIHAVCWGASPSEEKIRVDIHNLADPSGTPSDHPAVVGRGDAKEPPEGVPGVVLVRINTIDLYTPCPGLPGLPLAGATRRENEPDAFILSYAYVSVNSTPGTHYVRIGDACRFVRKSGSRPSG